MRPLDPLEVEPIGRALATKTTRVDLEVVGPITSLVLRRASGPFGRIDFAYYPFDPIGRRGLATISIPPVTGRLDELDRVLEAYAWDAVEELGAARPSLQPVDLELVRASGIATLDEIEEAARRMVAFRNWSVTDGARQLGIRHGALSRWLRRRQSRRSWPALGRNPAWRILDICSGARHPP